MSLGPGSRPPSLTLQWNPDVDLYLLNADTRSITCVGNAPSKGRRCQNRVASAREGRAALFLLATTGPVAAARSNSLEKAATSTLCHLHKAQAQEIVTRWRAQLQDLVAVDSSHSESSIRDEYREMTDEQLLKRLFILYDVLNSRPSIQQRKRDEQKRHDENRAQRKQQSGKDKNKNQVGEWQTAWIAIQC
jgi:hypothetical protein